MIIYLVRHGQTDWNNERRFQGHRDIPLNEAGIRQINDLADKIAGEKIVFDKLITSPLDRAGKSAEILAQKTGFNKEIIIDEDLIERDCGALEGVVWSPDLNPDDPKNKMETIPDLCERAKRAIEKYNFSEDEKIMIVSHGAILTAVRTALSGNRIDYFDNSIPVIQGNVLCCRIEKGKDTEFFNLF